MAVNWSCEDSMRMEEEQADAADESFAMGFGA